MPRVSFSDGTGSIEVPSGARLPEILGEIDYRGVLWGCCQGICGTCRFEPGSGAEHLPPPTAFERMLLARVEAAPKERLACHVRVTRDLEVRPPRHR